MAVARRVEEVNFHEPREESRHERQAVTEDQIMAVLKAAMNILGTRLLLIIGLAGAIALGYLALQSANTNALWAQTIFSLTVFGPLIWLSSKRTI